jgi:hypothetical protein
MAAHKLPVAAEEKAANANGTVAQPTLKTKSPITWGLELLTAQRSPFVEVR